MADLQFTISEEKIQAMLFGERGMEVLTEALFNQLLQAEMTAHLGAGPSEQTEQRRGYRNGSYTRKLTTRVGTLELEVPRERKGTFKTELLERYQRNEKALVLALMEMVARASRRARGDFSMGPAPPHFPIQNCEKIWPRTSSLVTSPVMAPSACSASRRSSVSRSLDTPWS